MHDFVLHGRALDTVFVLTPVTDEARDWADQNIAEDAMYLGRGIAVEHRYVDPIVEGIEDVGLMVKRT